jgi:hypothetical protein
MALILALLLSSSFSHPPPPPWPPCAVDASSLPAQSLFHLQFPAAGRDLEWTPEGSAFPSYLRFQNERVSAQLWETLISRSCRPKLPCFLLVHLYQRQRGRLESLTMDYTSQHFLQNGREDNVQKIRTPSICRYRRHREVSRFWEPRTSKDTAQRLL